MRNYLFDRPVVTLAEKKRQKRKKRRLLWLIPAIAVAVGVGIFAAILLWPESVSPPAAGGEAYDESPDASDTAAMEPTILRAPVGDGTTLTICTEEREKLAASALYERALPSVVSVRARMGNRMSAGSGIIMSESGYVITNYHIIEGTSEAWVSLLTTGEGYDARLVGWAEDLDLAILKIEAEGLVPAEFGSSRDLIVGDPVYALGNPLGYLYGSLTEGIVSAPTRSVALDGKSLTLIQTSAPLNQGNSGGALLNEYGQVVGVTTAKMSDNKGDVSIEGVGLALPISEIRNQIDSIIQNGRVITPRIGIMCYAAILDDVEGVLVQSVTEGDPAEQAGIQPGDFITHANGTPFSSVEGLKDVLFAVGVGGEVVLSVQRGVEKLEIPVTLAG